MGLEYEPSLEPQDSEVGEDGKEQAPPQECPRTGTSLPPLELFPTIQFVLEMRQKLTLTPLVGGSVKANRKYPRAPHPHQP